MTFLEVFLIDLLYRIQFQLIYIYHVIIVEEKNKTKTWEKVLNIKLPEEINVDGHSLQRRRTWASVATIVLQALQHCFCNTKYFYYF